MTDDVLFLHPVALDARAVDWLDVPGLVATSLPGHGDRAPGPPGRTLDELADVIVAARPGPLHVVGCSMGGMLALHLALRHPDRVASLVLGYTTARVDPLTMEERAADTERRGAVGMVDDTMRRWFSDDALVASPLAAPVAYARERLVSTPTAVIADDWRAIAAHDVLDRLGELDDIPTTCVAGRNDRSTPLAAMQAVADGIDGARLVVTDHPHMGFLERPQEFSAIVREHLEQARSVR